MWAWVSVGKDTKCFRNVIKGAACVQTSVPFKNAVKDPVYKKCVRLSKFIIPSVVSFSRCQMAKNKV